MCAFALYICICVRIASNGCVRGHVLPHVFVCIHDTICLYILHHVFMNTKCMCAGSQCACGHASFVRKDTDFYSCKYVCMWLYIYMCMYLYMYIRYNWLTWVPLPWCTSLQKVHAYVSMCIYMCVYICVITIYIYI